MSNNDKEVLKEDYKKLADFLGYLYFPYSKDKGVQNKEYPGWFRASKLMDSEEDRRIFTYKSPCFITRNTLSLNFKKDWNMLLKVVDKIESIEDQKYGGFKVKMESDCCLIQSNNKTKESAYSKMYCTNKDKLKAVYESCLLFVEWFNNNLRNESKR